MFVAGASTYRLGVYDATGVLLNDANGRLALPAGQHAVRVAGSNVGSFAARSHFRMVPSGPTASSFAPRRGRGRAARCSPRIR